MIASSLVIRLELNRWRRVGGFAGSRTIKPQNAEQLGVQIIFLLKTRALLCAFPLFSS